MAKNIPEDITRQDVLDAIAAYSDGSVQHSFHESEKFDLLHDGKRYPPKAILGIAARRSAGHVLEPSDFSGGEGSACFRILRRCGFEIVLKPNAREGPKTFLYTWNPSKWDWSDLKDVVKIVETGTPHDRYWSCGNTKRIGIGDRFLLMRLGVDPKGILGCGEITSKPYFLPHWHEEKRERGEEVLRTNLRFSILAESPILALHDLMRRYPDVRWTPQSSGNLIPEEVASAVMTDMTGAAPHADFKYPSGAAGLNAQQRAALEAKLHEAMLDLYERAGREAGYWANYFLRTVKRHGGFVTACRMLKPNATDKIDKGLQALIEVGRADELSVEAIALSPEFRLLFTPAELAEASRRLENVPESAKQKAVPSDNNFSDTVDESVTYVEGAVKRVQVNAFERNPKARAACLAKHGHKCMVCLADFGDTYGEIGQGFIHVHHKNPQALRREEYRINPVKDLAPVCPNCHAMLHSKNPPLTIDQLREIYDKQSKLKP
jgi:5-methylcytosine-specific restriction protein A